MTTAAMKNDVRGGSASEKSTLRYFPANGVPSWGLLLWLLGFKRGNRWCGGRIGLTPSVRQCRGVERAEEGSKPALGQAADDDR